MCLCVCVCILWGERCRESPRVLYARANFRLHSRARAARMKSLIESGRALRGTRGKKVKKKKEEVEVEGREKDKEEEAWKNTGGRGRRRLVSPLHGDFIVCFWILDGRLRRACLCSLSAPVNLIEMFVIHAF